MSDRDLRRQRQRGLLAPSPTILMIGGAPRSGTTLLCDMLNERPLFAIMAEYRFDELLVHLHSIFDYEREHDAGLELAGYNLTADASLGQSGGSEEIPSAALASSDVGPRETHYEPQGSPPLRHVARFPRKKNLAEIAANVVRTSLGKPFASVIGSKSPLFMVTANHLSVRQHFADVRYVFLFRNPLHQINSSANRRNRARAGLDNWRHNAVEDMIHEFKQVAASTFSLAQHFPQSCYFIKYEDLALDPFSVVSDLGVFLGVPAIVSPDFAGASNAARMVLTDSEQQSVREAFADASETWDKRALTGGASRRFALVDFLDPIPEGIEFDVQATCLGIGWSAAEAGGVWSVGATSELVFGATASSVRRISVRCAPFHPKPDDPLACRIEFNERRLADLRIGVREGKITAIDQLGNERAICDEGWLDLGDVMPKSAGANRVTFRFLNPKRPIDFGMRAQSDYELGLRLRAIRFLHS